MSATDPPSEASPERSSPATSTTLGVQAVIRAGRDRLVESGTPPQVAAAESRQLLGHVLDLGESQLLVLDGLAPADAARFDELIARRVSGTPVQHLTGTAHFRRISLQVGPGVFVPRPETEVMTGWAIDELRRRIEGQDGRTADRVPVAVDLCTGSGAVVASLDEEVPGARLYAVELAEAAAKYAGRNLAGRPVELRVEDIAETLPELDGQVDLVTANPPYIPLEAWESVTAEVRDHDPELSLFSGPDGLAAIRVVATTSARLLRPGGVFCCEHAELQEQSAAAVFLATGAFTAVRDHQDLNDRPRFTTGRRI